MTDGSSSAKDCLNCHRYYTCGDPNKGLGYYCSDYKPLRIDLKELGNRALTLEDKRGRKYTDTIDLKEATSVDEDDDSFAAHLAALGAMRTPEEVLKQIDHRDLPLARNYFEWMTGSEFNNEKPYAKQVQIGLHLFGEICPICTGDDYWLEEGFPVDGCVDGYERLQRHVVMLEYGVCPKCGWTQRGLFREKYLNEYVELAVCCGQRCVTGEMPVLTDRGWLPMGDIVKYASPDIKVWTPNGYVSPTRWYASLAPEKIYEVITRSGHLIRGSAEHPILTTEGWTPLPNCRNGMMVPVIVGWDTSPPNEIDAHHAEMLRSTGIWKHSSNAYESGHMTESRARRMHLWLQSRGVLAFLYPFRESFRIAIKGHYPLKRLLELVDVQLPPFDQIKANPLTDSLPNGMPRTSEDPTPYYVPIGAVRPAPFEVVYDITVPPDHEYLCAGLRNHNSGKSVNVAQLASYQTHRMLKLPEHCADYYGQARQQVLTLTFTSYTWRQAVQNLWTPFAERLENDWFKEYRKVLDQVGHKTGIELYKHSSGSFFYRNQGIRGQAAAPNRSSLRGSTGFFMAPDELGWFNVNRKDQVKVDANAIFDAMNNSLATIQMAANRLRRSGVNHVPTGIMASVSSPSATNDGIMQRVNEAQRNRTIYALNLPTWEMNPDYTEQWLRDRYSPEVFERDYAARPSGSHNPYVQKYQHVLPCFQEGKENYANVKRIPVELTTNGTKMVSAEPRWRYRDNAKVPKIMTLDAGVKFNSFAVVIGHHEEEEILGANKQVVGTRLISVIDLAAEVIPLERRTVSLHHIFSDLLMPLILEMNVRMVAADRWQQIKMLEDLEVECFQKQHEIMQLTHSVKYHTFTELKTALTESFTIRLPDLEMPASRILHHGARSYPECFNDKPLSHLLYQILTVEDLSGREVTKGPNSTDDIFRALATFWAVSHDPEMREAFTGFSEQSRLTPGVWARRAGQAPGSRTGVIARSAGAAGNAGSSGIASYGGRMR